MEVRAWFCMACHKEGADVLLDFDTPGTRDALWDIHYPTHIARNVALCAKHSAPLWDLEGLGEMKAGGTAFGPAKIPYHVKQDHSP